MPYFPRIEFCGQHVNECRMRKRKVVMDFLVVTVLLKPPKMKNAQLPLLVVVVLLAALLAADGVAIRPKRSNSQTSDSELTSNSSVCYW